MPASAPKLTIAPGLELPEDVLLRVVGMFNLPGETVFLNKRARLVSEPESAVAARRDLFGDQALTVKETLVDLDDPNALRIRYTFEEVEGVHGAWAFEISQDVEHLLGVMIGRGSQTWFVPFKNDEENPYEVEGPPRLISTELPRAARYAFGVDDPVLRMFRTSETSHEPLPSFASSSLDEDLPSFEFRDDAAFFAGHEEAPAYGEFVFYPEAGSDRLVLLNSPWWAATNAKELAAAERAVDEMLKLEPGSPKL